MNDAIRDSATQRGITRVCHFAPSRNLVHIATDPRGLLATDLLKDDEKAVFNPTDLARLDGHRGHICCSVQYPNAWYFRQARRQDRMFPDWVVLLMNPQHLWMPGTKFCPRNAASGWGRDIREGTDGFEAMFQPAVAGAYGRTYTRTVNQSLFLPTDEQAEVLIADRVAREDVLGIVVADVPQAKREIVRLQTLHQRVPRVIVAGDFFDAYCLSRILRSGNLPVEVEYYSGDAND